MKKFINSVDHFLEESLRGFAAAHADLVELHLHPTFLTRRHPAAGKVALVSGGGSGHEPLHSGFLGYGMLDAVCPGQVFTSPTPDQMLKAGETADSGAGVLFIVKNYSGDIMNFEMAAELADFKCASVIVQDDVALQGSAHATGRRGVMGTVIYEKVLGALAEEGASLETLVGVAQRLEARVASMGVALSSCTVPAAGRPTFTLEDDQIEVGVGIHGEAGRRRDVLRPARELVQELMEVILGQLRPLQGVGQNEAQDDGLLLIVNGMGGTPLAELYLLYHEARQVLEPLGLRVERSLVGNYTTALDMAGASLTVCLLDDEIRRAWDAPVHTAALRWGR